MAGGNNTNPKCPTEDQVAFQNSMGMQFWQANALILINIIMAGVIVGIGAYGKRYRYHPFTRFIFLGATTLFLPIISSVISTVGSSSNDYANVLYGDDGSTYALVVECTAELSHLILVITWAFLIHITMINTCTVVAGDDREGRNAGLPLELLVQGGWTFYLAVSIHVQYQKNEYQKVEVSRLLISYGFAAIQYALFAIICAKIIFKYYALEKAQRSIAFGRNPRLIFGYMLQLQVQEASQPSDPSPPPLLVMGEKASHVKKQPHGYAFQYDLGSTTTSAISNIDGLMTIDRVWQYDEDMMLKTSGVQVKYICLSFSLFKLLRCRFARYNVSKVGTMGTLNFLWSLFLKDGEHVRIFQLVADELSFLDDYYYSSLPISFSKWWLPILSVSISLSTISYCMVTVSFILQWAQAQGGDLLYGQMVCYYWCGDTHPTDLSNGFNFLGLSIIDAVAPCLLIVLVMISEVKDLASYLCSKWTKVVLFCRFVNNTTWQHSFWTWKWVGIMLRCRWKLMMKHWDEKIGQCSVLVLHQRRTTPIVHLMRLFRFPERKRKVKIPEAVKVCIIRALRSSRNGGLSQGTSSLRQTQAGERLLWACNGKGTSDTILVWHIATCIFEHQQEACCKQGSPSNLDHSNHKIVATYLSRYCAYLMVSLPELLPDDDAWSKDLYKAVKKDADRVLAGHAAVKSSSTPEEKCQQLVELLGEGSKNEELKNGVKLGKQLVELAQGSEEELKNGPVQFMFITHGVQLVVGLGPVVLATIEHHGVVHLSSPDNCIVYEEVRSVLYFQGILRGRGSMRRPSREELKFPQKHSAVTN